MGCCTLDSEGSSYGVESQAGNIHRQRAINTAALAPLPLDPNAPRRLVFIDALGQPSFAKVEKSVLVKDLGITHRDFRLLDPWLPQPYPTAILVRDNALLVNLECIRMIIKQDRCVVLSIQHGLLDNYSEDCCHLDKFEDCSFIQELSRATVDEDSELPYELRALEAALAEAVRVLEDDVDDLMDAESIEILARQVSMAALEEVRQVKRSMNVLSSKTAKLRSELLDILDDDQDMRAMYLTRISEKRATTRGEDDGTTPFRLPKNWDPEKRDAVAAACTRIKRVSSKAQRGAGVRGSVDRGDSVQPGTSTQASMERGASAGPSPSMGGAAGGDPSGGSILGAVGGAMEQAGQQSMSGGLPPADSTPFEGSAAGSGLFAGMHVLDEDELSTESAPGHLEQQTSLMDVVILEQLADMQEEHAAGVVKRGEIDGVEGLLEAYYMQVDFITSKLRHLKEGIDDTEDLVNLELDHRRNELFALELLVTMITLAFSFVAMVAGVFGMNLESSGWPRPGSGGFWTVTGISVAIGVVILIGIGIFVRLKGLMFIPDVTVLKTKKKN